MQSTFLQGRVKRPRLLAFVAAALAFSASPGCTTTSRTTRVESSGEVSGDVIPVSRSTLPSGTTLQARLDQTLGTNKSKVGDTFTASVQSAVTTQNGETVVPSGAVIQGHVTALEASRNATEPAVIRLAFDRLSFGGRSYPFEASVARAAARQTGGDTRDETLRKAGIGAAAGALLGAVLGDAELKNMAIGAVLGAGVGTAISLGTGTVDSALPAGTTLTLRTTQDVALR
jgi:hypothetical protein